jgi:hypothetical protein
MMIPAWLILPAAIACVGALTLMCFVLVGAW